MRVAVVSDSHGDLFMLDKALKDLENIHKIIHLGDHFEDIIQLNKKYKKDIIYVAGNNDYDKGDTALKEKVVELEGVKIFIAHGHKYNVYYGIDKLYYRCKELNCNIALFGHTHKQFYQVEDNITFINPGSISYPRDVAPGIAVIDIEKGKYTVDIIRF